MSLIWLSYCVSFPKLYTGKEIYLSNLATRAVKNTFEKKKIKRLTGEWDILWFVSVERRSVSNVADGTMFVAKYKLYKSIKSNVKDGFNTDDSDNKDDYIFRYVISIAGTKPFSIFAAVFQDLSIFKTRP